MKSGNGKTAVIMLTLVIPLLSMIVGFRLFTGSSATLRQGEPDAKRVRLDDPSFMPPAVAYQPRGFVPGSEASVFSREQVVSDLRLLKTTGFRSLVTYGAHGMLGSVPQIARQEGFNGTVIMGLWELFAEEEWENAVAQAPFVDGYCLGNEGLGIRYSTDELASKMAELRRVTGRPVTTSEPIDSYLTGSYRAWLLAHSDWLFPLAHPFLAAQSDPHQAVNWIVARHDYLAATAGSRVMLKEVGFPSAGAVGGSESAQRAFFERLEAKGLPFFYFEAFDQPWKRDVLGQPEVEAHWGLYRADGTPKQVILWLANRWSR